MFKKILVILLVIILLIVLVLGLINNYYCKDETHRDVYPVNPYCTKCHGKDGIKQHECTNPNGKDKYCRSCGKKI